MILSHEEDVDEEGTFMVVLGRKELKWPSRRLFQSLIHPLEGPKKSMAQVLELLESIFLQM